MEEPLAEGVVFAVPDESIGESVVDEMFDVATAAHFAANHPLASRCDRFIGRDPGDNLIVVAGGSYWYWDHETDRLIVLGKDPAQFIVQR